MLSEPRKLKKTRLSLVKLGEGEFIAGGSSNSVCTYENSIPASQRSRKQNNEQEAQHLHNTIRTSAPIPIRDHEANELYTKLMTKYEGRPTI